jgi:hypothetical protein
MLVFIIFNLMSIILLYAYDIVLILLFSPALLTQLNACSLVTLGESSSLTYVVTYCIIDA